MLLFHCLSDEYGLHAAQRHGLQSTEDEDLRLFTSFEAATDAAAGPVLVVDPTALNSSVSLDGDTAEVSAVPASALQNVDPYRPPQPVTAAGGYVARPLAGDIALLLIYRRGVWDLPKGHQDPGEDLQTCALREVREEVGVETLHLLRHLGTTQHGYPEGDIYAIKTTYWYLMRTPERSFQPERHEGIRRVTWARWSVAYRHLGYDTLRRHMDRVETDVIAALS